MDVIFTTRSYRFSSHFWPPKVSSLKMNLPKIVRPGIFVAVGFFFFFSALDFLFWRKIFPSPPQKKKTTKWRHNFFFEELQVVHGFFLVCGRWGGGRFLKAFFATPWQKCFQNSLRMCKFFEMNRGQLKTVAFNMVADTGVILGRLHL